MNTDVQQHGAGPGGDELPQRLGDPRFRPLTLVERAAELPERPSDWPSPAEAEGLAARVEAERQAAVADAHASRRLQAAQWDEVLEAWRGRLLAAGGCTAHVVDDERDAA